MTGSTLLHYRIIKPLGKGGMGKDRLQVIKLLPEFLRSDPERLARFRREAEAAAQSNHPNIAHIYALEEAVPVQDDASAAQRPDRRGTARRAPTSSVLFIVMEYVDGEPLYNHIPSGGMDIDAFFDAFVPLADALAHTHGHSRVHRDLKPGNIMIATDVTPKILDFGLARILSPTNWAVWRCMCSRSRKARASGRCRWRAVRMRSGAGKGMSYSTSLPTMF